MKRAERHHLKENELRTFARHAADAVEARGRETTIVLAVVAAIAIVALGYWGWRSRVNSKADAMLAEAMTVAEARIGPPPAPGTPAGGLYFPTERERSQAALTKFKAAADAYPSTDAGIFARYQEAATSLALGNSMQATVVFQQVIDKAGDSFYGQMARLGRAEAMARAGQYDQAINTYKEMAQRKDGPLPVDGILMQLGRTYVQAGKRAEAQQTFNRLVQEYPDSAYASDARKELDNLKKT